MIIMAHGIETGFEPIGSRELLRQQVQYVHTQEKSLWIDTFGNIARYRNEFEASRLTVLQNDDRSLRIAVRCPELNPSVYNVPLTLVIDAPGVSEATATIDQTSQVIQTELHGEKQIVFDLVPGNTSVTVRWK